MLGAATYRGFLPSRNFEYFLSPMYSFKTNSLVGLGKANLYFPLKKSPIKYMKLGVSYRSFHDGQKQIWEKTPIGEENILLSSEDFRYQRLVPEIEFRFRKKNVRSSILNRLKFRHININHDEACGEVDSLTICSTGFLRDNDYGINELSFEHRNQRLINPYGFQLMAEQGDGFIKTSIEADYKITYVSERKGIRFRVFGSLFPVEPDNSQFVPHSLGYKSNTNNYDYKMDNLVFARNRTEGGDSYNLLTHQTAENPTGFHINTALGNNSTRMVALNLEADVPFSFPAQLYFNLASFPNPLDVAESDNAFELGANLALIPDAFEIHFPFAFSQNLEDRLNSEGFTKYYERITFTLQLNRLDLFDQLRKNRQLN